MGSVGAQSGVPRRADITSWRGCRTRIGSLRGHGILPRLDATKRAKLPDRAFAYVDSRGRRRLPIHDAAHVRNALARLVQVGFEDDRCRERSLRRRHPQRLPDARARELHRDGGAHGGEDLHGGTRRPGHRVGRHAHGPRNADPARHPLPTTRDVRAPGHPRRGGAVPVGDERRTVPVSAAESFEVVPGTLVGTVRSLDRDEFEAGGTAVSHATVSSGVHEVVQRTPPASSVGMAEPGLPRRDRCGAHPGDRRLPQA